MAHLARMADVYAGLPVLSAMQRQPSLDRAGGGVAGGVRADRAAVADGAWKAPVRAPLTLPAPDLTLFAPEYLTTAVPVAVPASSGSVPASAPTVVGSVASAGVVRARSETTYYDVRGKSREDLAAALRRNGPNIRGSRFFGLTEWQVSVEYRPADEAERCAISDLTVHIAVETHLPRWTPSAEASKNLHGAWDHFVAALDEHERGHRVLAEEAAEAIRHELARVQAAACDQLDPLAQRAMTAVMSTYESRNLAYDAETGHGRTQGAVWPPTP